MVSQSRWGYHPCNYATYLQLRRLHRAYWEGRRLLAKWRRWAAKPPKNRTRPEPLVPAAYHEVCAAPVPEVFRAARHGVPTPEDVQPLPFSAEQIERWLHQLE